MAALRSRMRTLYFRPAASSSVFFFSFHRLFSAVTGWMSAILPHVVWPLWEFRMQAWNVLQTARWKYRTQKIAKSLPSAHHRTTLSGNIFPIKAHIDNRKNAVKQHYLSTCSNNMVNIGPLAAEIGSGVKGTPTNFNCFLVLASLLQRKRTTLCTMFGRLLGWYTMYAFSGALAP